MNKRLVVLLGVLAVSVGSAQADWIKHEGHGATAKGAISSITRIHFNQVKHSDLDGFVTACKASCDEKWALLEPLVAASLQINVTCEGFVLNYANTDKTRPASCVFSKEGSTLVDMPTKDFYQAITHDEVLALLEQLVPNLNTQEDAKWLTEVVKDAEFMVCGKATESNCDGKLKRTGPPTDAGSGSASTASSRDNASELPDGSCQGPGKFTDDLNTGCGWISAEEKRYYIQPKAILFRANLSGTNLSDANLIGANLWSANLTGAKLARAGFYGVGANSSTICPDGRTWYWTGGHNCPF